MASSTGGRSWVSARQTSASSTSSYAWMSTSRIPAIRRQGMDGWAVRNASGSRLTASHDQPLMQHRSACLGVRREGADIGRLRYKLQREAPGSVDVEKGRFRPTHRSVTQCSGWTRAESSSDFSRWLSASSHRPRARTVPPGRASSRRGRVGSTFRRLRRRAGRPRRSPGRSRRGAPSRRAPVPSPVSVGRSRRGRPDGA